MQKVFVPITCMLFVVLGTCLYLYTSSQLKQAFATRWAVQVELMMQQVPRAIRRVDAHIDAALLQEKQLTRLLPDRDSRQVLRSFTMHLQQLFVPEDVSSQAQFTLALIDASGNIITENQYTQPSLLSVLLAEAQKTQLSLNRRYHRLMQQGDDLLLITSITLPTQQLLLVIHPLTIFSDLTRQLQREFGPLQQYKVSLAAKPVEQYEGVLLGPMWEHSASERLITAGEEYQIEHTSPWFGHQINLSVSGPLFNLSVELDSEVLATELTYQRFGIVGIMLGLTLLILAIFYALVIKFVIAPLDKYAQQLDAKEGVVHASDIEISELRDSYLMMRKNMRSLVEKDELTGLQSRRYFVAELKRLIVLQQGSVPAYLVYLDIDNFKWLNDHISRAAADRFLVEFAAKLRRLVTEYVESSSHVAIARLTSDQFGLYVDGTGSFSRLLQLVNAIQELFSNGYQFEFHALPLSVSLGIVEIEQTGSTVGIEALQTQAERALEAAKQVDGNHYQFYNVDIAQQIRSSEIVERALVSSLIHDGFRLMFMPIVEAKNQHTRGYEVLLRCPELEEQGFSAEEYVTQAEKLGLIEDVDLWVLRNSFTMIKRISQSQSTVPIFSINISALELSNERFVSQVTTLVEQYQIDTSKVELEITETAFVPNQDDGGVTLNALKDLGFRLALDDFGSGYTSFYQLAHYPFDVLKIDKVFIEMLNDAIGAEPSMAKVIYSLAKTHNLELVAEGVENASQVDYLTQLGCEMLQGYYFSKPISQEQAYSAIIRQPLSANSHLSLVTKNAL
ncbi:putative bifunctional diguanylate cyclase/phosphodiesterase [Vibrio sp. WXL210]|uniref:putative bifunctional diguanylate cyclase/phosphodiesterase n=1 Tax=Vibrio sp. WXL210 TaxID=3450709 RepID=UPI003EC4E4BA